jgi:hypothetical protein
MTLYRKYLKQDNKCFICNKPAENKINNSYFCNVCLKLSKSIKQKKDLKKQENS